MFYAEDSTDFLGEVSTIYAINIAENTLSQRLNEINFIWLIIHGSSKIDERIPDDIPHTRAENGNALESDYIVVTTKNRMKFYVGKALKLTTSRRFRKSQYISRWDNGKSKW